MNSIYFQYLNDIAKYPLLTREQEKILIELSAKGNRRAQDLLVKSNLKFVVNIANLYKGQGLDVNELINEGLDFDLWILGEGEDRQKLEKYISENNLCENVKMLGFQNNPYPFIKSADLLVCSSNYEGFSTFVTEGLILGKPVVTTDCSGMYELLGENEYGLITENDDKAFENGLRKMLSDPVMLSDYTEKAKLRGKQFSKEKLTAETEKLFFRTLEK